MQNTLMTMLLILSCAGCRTQTPVVAPAPDEEQPQERPAEATSPSAPPTGTLLLATATGESFSTWSYGFESARMERIASGFLATHVSPSGQRLIGVIEGSSDWAVYDRNGNVVHTFPSGYFGAALVDDTHVLICRRGQGSGSGTRSDEILSVDLESGSEVVLVQIGGSIWDDVHLRLSPDGRHATFSRLGGERGMYALNLDAKEVSLLVQDGAGAWWSPDGSRFLCLLREPERALAMFRFINDHASRERLIYTGTSVGGWFDDQRLLILRGTEQGAGSVFVHDLQSREERVVASDIFFDNFAGFGFFAALGDGSVALLGASSAQGLDLRRVVLDEGPGSFEVLASNLGEIGIILGHVDQ